jgi:hypothetical protein
MESPAYYRARIEAIEMALIFENLKPESRDQSMRIAYLRNGHVPDKFLFEGANAKSSEVYTFVTETKGRTTIDQYIDRLLKGIAPPSNEPLTQDEIAQYDTWFTMHPEKVGGKQVGNSGFSFPVKTLGSPEHIQDAINATLDTDNTDELIAIAEAEAEAIEIELLLLRLNTQTP